MRAFVAAAACLLLVSLSLLLSPAPEPLVVASEEATIRRALEMGSGVVHLGAGILEISSELVIPEGSDDVEIIGAPSGTVLRAADNFRGRAVLRARSATRIRISHLTIDGNRAALEEPLGLPPSHVPFSRFYANNGFLAEDVRGLTITKVGFRDVANFPILVSHSSGVLIEGVKIENSGSQNFLGRNNSTGGILLEEGTTNFVVRDSVLTNVRGNGIWTHSLYTSPRNRDGQIVGNRLDQVARDAIQVGHASNIRVERNYGARIGYPAAEVDVEARATPAAIDTAGNTDRSVYAENRFEEVNGKCIDLDGFHNGEVRDNSCRNRRPREEYPNGHYGIVMNNSNPDMRSERILIRNNEIDGALFGGIFVIGSKHKIVNNRLRNLNLAHCNDDVAHYGCYYLAGEPDILRSGIYLGRGAERPAVTRNNLIQDNEVSGYKIQENCIVAAPGVSLSENAIDRNHCSGGAGAP